MIKFLSIMLLSLVISVISIPLLFGQNTPASNPFHGSIVVNPSAPTGSFTINANGDAQFGTDQGLDMVQIGTGNHAMAANLTAASGQFKYLTTGTADAIQFSGGDIFIRTFASGSAGNTAVPLTAMQIKNGAPSGSMLLDATGNLTMPAIKSTTGTRYVCVDTAGKLVSSATACSGT